MPTITVPYNPPASSTIGQLFNNANAAALARASANLDTPASAIVTLSVQGQMLSKTPNAQISASNQNGQTQNGADALNNKNTNTNTANIQNDIMSNNVQAVGTKQNSAPPKSADSAAASNQTNAATNTKNNAAQSSNGIDSAAQEAQESPAKEATESVANQTREGETQSGSINIYA